MYLTQFIYSKTKQLIFCSLLFLALSFFSQAQTSSSSPEGEPILPTRISYLLAGDPPGQTKGNGIPNSIRAKGRLPDLEEDSVMGAQGASLKLITDLVDYPLPENTPLDLEIEAGNLAGKLSTWFKDTIPAGPVGRDLTILFYKENVAHNWNRNKPKSLLLDNSFESVPEGAIRVINVSSYPVYCLINGKEVALQPKAYGVLTEANTDSQRLECQFSYLEKKTNEKEVFFTNNFQLGGNQRLQLVFYNLDGVRGRSLSPVNMMRNYILPLDRPTIQQAIQKRKERKPIKLRKR